MRVLLLVLALLAAGLAGCADDQPVPRDPTSADCIEQGLILDPNHPAGPRCVEPPFEVRHFEDPEHYCVLSRQRDRMHAPDLAGDPWVLGQYWDYALEVDGASLGTTRLVYYGDQDFAGGIPQHYMVGTLTREEALRHAVFSENPVIGRVHRILYSPHESGDHADMFHFPLCSGSSWTTTFYGERFELTAQEATLELPQGTDEGYAIAGSSPSGSTLRLSYSPAAKWFTYIDLERADGTGVSMELDAMGTGHEGPAYFLRGQQDLTWTPDGAVAGIRETPVPREEGAEGPYDAIALHVDLGLEGDATGLYRFQVLDPAGMVRYAADLGSLGNGTASFLGEIPFVAGTWTIREVSVPPLGLTPVGSVTFVSVYDRSGSV